ncbi:MAG: hypothetical protein RL708_199 [Bacteroidota bacterium]|jgi:hypothetical protein
MRMFKNYFKSFLLHCHAEFVEPFCDEAVIQKSFDKLRMTNHWYTEILLFNRL